MSKSRAQREPDRFRSAILDFTDLLERGVIDLPTYFLAVRSWTEPDTDDADNGVDDELWSKRRNIR